MTDKTRVPLDGLTTEARNPLSLELDSLSPIEIVKLINSEDEKCALAVRAESESIAQAIGVVANRLSRGGRLIYVGAGTSGRLGVLDAVECPPTFNTEAGKVLGIIAGGPEGLMRAIEGAEDSREMGQDDLQKINLGPLDVVFGITASGRTPFVIGALEYARDVGAFAIGFTCNEEAEITPHTDLMIAPLVGPEVLSGSTRLKAGTATKMVLNMITTGAMVLMGKSYSNLMVDLSASNSKLLERAIGIVRELTGCNQAQATELLQCCDGELKTAIVTHTLDISPDQARARLESAGGHLRHALETIRPGDG